MVALGVLLYVGEFCKRKELQPVVLLVVAVNPKVLLKGLISVFSLTIALWVVTGGEVQAHIESFTQGLEEVRDELGALIGGDVDGDSMLGEDMEEEQLG